MANTADVKAVSPASELAPLQTAANRPTIYPAPVRPGDKIAILAPAGKVNGIFIDLASAVIQEMGYNPVIFPTARGENGSFSGTARERFDDLKEAFGDPEIRAIICGRGGYGTVHLLDSLNALPLEKDPKWLVGFSDISALHAMLANKGIASVHASMVRQIAKGADDNLNTALFDILRGEFPSYNFPPDSLNHLGRAEGKLLGGNLAVLQALIGTPYNIIEPGTILFIEDVAEPVYKVERILYQLKMAGILENLNGLVVGQFNDFKEDGIYEDMYGTMAGVLADYPDLPVAFNLPIGHISGNIPLVESAWANLEITPEGVSLALSPQ